MAFVKLVKNNTYYKRYQVKMRRRRQGKTDYQARYRLIQQAKNKYSANKYRFCVRRTNRRIICQYIYATVKGDRILTQADSTELKRYGVPCGLTNYAAAYCTGLLSARRLLTQLKMADMYKGVPEATGELYSVYKAGQVQDRRPFKAFLDTGLVRCTTGNRVFGALKGAVDGGVYIPHNNKRFPGFNLKKDREPGEKAKGAKFQAAVHKDHIFGNHVDEYIEMLEGEEGQEKFNRHFKNWNKFFADSGVETTADVYKKAHAAIRADPSFKKKEARKNAVHKTDKFKTIYADSKGRKWRRDRKTSKNDKRKAAMIKIKKALGAKAKKGK